MGHGGYTFTLSEVEGMTVGERVKWVERLLTRWDAEREAAKRT